MLKQSSLEVGNLNLPPSTVLKVLKDSVKLPPWMVVRAKEEEIFIDLSNLPISDDLQVRAKEINLLEDEILLEIIIPKKRRSPCDKIDCNICRWMFLVYGKAF